MPSVTVPAGLNMGPRYRYVRAPKPEPQAARYVDDLIGRGLLVEFDPDGDLQPVFSRHKLLPLAQGLGSTPEAPHQHRIGIGDHALVAVPNSVYGLWSFSFQSSDLWSACFYYAAADQEESDPAEEPLGISPESIARDVAENLPVMVSTGCAFLDPVVDECTGDGASTGQGTPRSVLHAAVAT